VKHFVQKMCRRSSATFLQNLAFLPKAAMKLTLVPSLALLVGRQEEDLASKKLSDDLMA